MTIGLKSRVFIGFVVILVTFAGTSLFAVQRMQRIREDLRLIHKGYLNMTRLATQVRTLQEAKDEYVQRALTETELDVRRYLVGYARTFYPKVLRDRLREIEVLAEGLARTATSEIDRKFLATVTEQVARAQTLHDAYDEATGALLGQLGTDDPTVIELLLETYRERSDALSRETQALSLGMETKLDEAVLRAERSERDAGFAVIVLSLVALLVSAAVMVGINRGLRPLSVLLDSARAIGQGSLDVRVDIETDDEVGALATEFNSMAKALKDREQVLATQNLDLARLKAFSDDVIRSVRVGIVVLDEEGRVRVLNPAARSVFGLPLVDV